MVTMASTPAHAAIRRNQRLFGMSRRKIHDSQYHAASRNRKVPEPTMTSQERWTVLTSLMVGWSSVGTVSSPCTTVALPVLGSDNHDASPGMGMPPVTSPSEFNLPNSVSGTSLLVDGTSSIAANFSGWLL